MKKLMVLILLILVFSGGCVKNQGEHLSDDGEFALAQFCCGSGDQVSYQIPNAWWGKSAAELTEALHLSESTVEGDQYIFRGIERTYRGKVYQVQTIYEFHEDLFSAVSFSYTVETRAEFDQLAEQLREDFQNLPYDQTLPNGYIQEKELSYKIGSEGSNIGIAVFSDTFTVRIYLMAASPQLG